MDVNVEDFWKKIKSVKNSNRLIITALTLFYVMCDGDIPVWVKALCSSALIYFINPWDPFGPDPIIYADDIAILAAALTSISKHIKSSHKAQAKRHIKKKS